MLSSSTGGGRGKRPGREREEVKPGEESREAAESRGKYLWGELLIASQGPCREAPLMTHLLD